MVDVNDTWDDEQYADFERKNQPSDARYRKPQCHRRERIGVMEITVEKTTRIAKRIDLTEDDVKAAILAYVKDETDDGCALDVEIDCRQEFCRGATVEWEVVSSGN